MSDVSWPTGVEPVVPIPGYPNTWTHTPQRPAIARAPAPAATPVVARPLTQDAALRPWDGLRNAEFRQRIAEAERSAEHAEDAEERGGRPERRAGQARRQRRAAHLSAGQKRRACLARLVAVKRPLWLLDEPTVSLDTASVKLLAECVGQHLAGGGLVLAATHIPLGLASERRLEIGVRRAAA